MKKFTVVLLVLAMTAALFAGCGGGNGGSGGSGASDDGVIRVWVGQESAEFYQKICNDYVAANPDFGYKIEVKGMDTGTVAATVMTDPSAAADIYTVAHDNIGKLASGQCAKPIIDENLIAQVLSDNPASYQGVVYYTLNEEKYLYAVPYISQALFLYYNKDLVTDEQAKTFEGLKEAAAAANCKAVTVSGDDGFNFSFPLLATRVSDHGTTLKLYEGWTSTSKGEIWCQGDDTVAILRWLQAYTADDNGFKFPSSDNWNADFRNNGVVAVIGGAWHYKAAAAAVGEANLGITLIPTFKLTAESVEGLSDVKAGDEYRGGTFADCKCFMINAKSAGSKYNKEQELIKYLSSKEVQNQSYIECMNVPAYSGASEYIEQCYQEGKVTESQYALAASQIEMKEWGIPQPFLTTVTNNFYYQKSGPSTYRALVEKVDRYPATGDVVLDDTTSLAGIRKGLYQLNYIWKKGSFAKDADVPATLPAEP